MAGTISENGVGRSSEGNLSGEYLAEWRSSKQVENGITSTSPPFWDIDDEDDCGPKPSDLFGKYTWKIDKYSQIKKRELRSDTFETGSYKWYILIYPQGCDVCNHLSLFLCVANHDKLLPGWSHFAQFTITVVNKDLTKNKYSDTLHRFWKKEHDWGWKKYLEFKVLEGFVDNDQLIIEAKVQVIREIPDRPFRCLSKIYRHELVPVYITNIEQVCSHFVEERRNKLVKLRDDKDRWSSFCAFWVAIDQNTRRHMCREKTDNILRVIVKQCFIEKEVTSTLVMDSLYSGLKALECQNKSKLSSNKILNTEDRSFPIVYMENDMFVLVDDVLKLFGRVSIEPLPPKNDKGLHNRMKDGCVDGGSDDFIERCEKHLTALGRRTIEIFVLAHIFSKIEVAYQEAISLKRQEELIREEEIWLAETEQRVKHYLSEKEKKKKKKAKQRRKNHKGKIEKPSNIIEDDLQQVSSSDDKEELLAAVAEHLFDEINKSENTIDISDSVSCLPESPSPDSEERDGSWDTGASENIIPTNTSCGGVSGISGIKKGNRENNNFNLVDDSSSTCSTDSVPSVIMDGLYGGYSFPKSRNRKSLNRIKNQQGTRNVDRVGYYDEAHNRQPVATHSKVASLSLYDRKIDEHHMVKKEKVVSLQRKSSLKNQAIEDKSSKEKTKIAAPSLSTSSKIIYSNIPVKPVSKISGPTNPPIIIKKPFSDPPTQAERATSVINTADSTSAIKLEFPNKPKLPAVSRPLSAPVIPGPKPFTPIVSRSMSTGGCLGPETSSYRPLSYKNVIMGINSSDPPISSINPSQSHTQMSYSSISSFKPSQSHTQNSISQKSPLDLSNLHTEKPSSISASISSEPSISFKAINQNENNNYNSGLASTSQSRSQERPSQTGLGDDFPHLDIINNLLDEEQGFIMETLVAPHLPPHVSFPYDQDYYDDGYYGSLFAHFNSLDFGEMIPQINPGLYVNEPIDGLISSQWPIYGGDLSYYSGANMEVNNYPYNYMEYGNIACNVMDYTAFGPSNAH